MSLFSDPFYRLMEALQVLWHQLSSNFAVSATLISHMTFKWVKKIVLVTNDVWAKFESYWSLYTGDIRNLFSTRKRMHNSLQKNELLF